jgi:hypothetical protein
MCWELNQIRNLAHRRLAIHFILLSFSVPIGKAEMNSICLSYPVLCGFIEMVTEGIFVSLQREDFDD